MARLSLILVSVCMLSLTTADPGCVAVDPAPNYVNLLYIGHWFEIGRIQTAGGATFQEGCWCDDLDFDSENLEYGDGEVTYTCRKYGPQGELSSATADLMYDGVPGAFTQKFSFPFAPSLDYNVIYIDEDTAVEYDCYTGVFGETNYCVHFMSRTPYMDEEKLQSLIEAAEDLGLNNQNVTYAATSQEGCW